MVAFPEVPGFEIRRVIGRGAAATVFEAWDDTFGRSVAIKVLEGVDLTNAELLAFRQEIRAMGNLEDEPHVVPVYQSGATLQGSPYIVMRYVPGGSLADRVAESGPLPTEQVLKIGIDIGGALESAHRRGIRHCDIKPANLLHDDRHGAVLSDFGIAAVALGPLTQRQGMTVAYAAPEVLDDEVPSAASDIYSFGATVHALLTGAPPFGRGSNAAVMNKILSAPVPMLPDHFPEELRALVAAMMHKKPDARPQSGGDVAAAFQQILDGLDPGQASSAHTETGPAIPSPTETASRDDATRTRVRQAADDPSTQQASVGPARDLVTAKPRRAVTRAAVLLLILALPAVAIWQCASRDDATQVLASNEVDGVTVVAEERISAEPAEADSSEPSPAPTPSTLPTSAPAVAAPLPSTAAVTVDNSKVAVPSNLRATNQGLDPSGQLFIGLGWSKPVGATFVEIERDGVVVHIDDNLAHRDIPDPALTPGQQVTYRIRSLNTDQTTASEWSAPLTIIIEEPELDAPGNFKATNQGLDPSGRPFIGLGWSKPVGATFVEIERDGVVVHVDDNLAYRDVPDPALTPGQQVTYRIRSLNTDQTTASEWSAPLTITVSEAADQSVLGAPTNFASSGQGTNSAGQRFINLRWSKPANAAFVEITRDDVVIRIDDNLAYHDILDPTVAVGQQVTYQIRSLNTDQTAASDWSEPLTVTVNP